MCGELGEEGVGEVEGPDGADEAFGLIECGMGNAECGMIGGGGCAVHGLAARATINA